MFMFKNSHHIQWGGTTLTFVGDCVEDAHMHAVVHKFQSERDGVHMHPLPTGLVHVQCRDSI